ncbi:DUF4265 domain-containing protein [Phaeobacter sp. CECT 5382]|uniref:DUF4265 domain-containing protein n=1 Tax=Phaeobacter sp. CECT 5382 TaxID=1712645 RepID=UPI00071CAED7|nr:DUF4265 domain-containing protein [Phaeobacter sp. CECT 5382]
MNATDNQMHKVIFDLGSDIWHGHSTESVWATNLGSGVYRLENSPFFAKGISFRDAVMTSQVEGQIKVVGLGPKSGHSTYRILVLQDKHDPGLFAESWKPLEHLGCSYEHGNFGYQLYAIDVPASVDIETAYAFLERGEQKGAWDFEEGLCGHF